MAKDIAPQLASNINNTFDSMIAADAVIKGFNAKLANETVTQRDVFNYAQRVARHAASSLSFSITPEVLPDGRIYWNIATRTIKPLLQRVHELINDAANAVQSIEDRKANIGIKPKSAPFPDDRISDLLNKLCSLVITEEGEDE